jgi:hypothetical protein
MYPGGGFFVAMAPSEKAFSHFDIIDACALPGCPLCRLSDAVVQRYLDAIVYECVNDPPTRELLTRAQGYCNEHAWRLTQASGGAALSVAFVYRGLLADIDAALADAPYGRRGSLFKPDKDSRQRVAAGQPPRSLQPELACPACAQRDQMEALALRALVEALARRDAPMQAALAASAGLCLVHLRGALALAGSAPAFDFLRDDARQHLARLAAELSEYIRKNDYRFAGEPFGAEGDSWQRAVAAMVGTRGLR